MLKTTHFNFRKTNLWVSPKLQSLRTPRIMLNPNTGTKGKSWLGFSYGAKPQHGDKTEIMFGVTIHHTIHFSTHRTIIVFLIGRNQIDPTPSSRVRARYCIVECILSNNLRTTWTTKSILWNDVSTLPGLTKYSCALWMRGKTNSKMILLQMVHGSPYAIFYWRFAPHSKRNSRSPISWENMKQPY